MRPVSFAGLLSQSGVEPINIAGDAEIRWVTADSRSVMPGSLFVAMPSASSDSHTYAEAAREAGAVACLAHSKEGFSKAWSAGLASAWVEPADFNSKVGSVCRTLFEDPTSKMRVLAVTGTNGKTTTAWMLRDALQALGRRAAYLGTLGFQVQGERRTLANTTPFPVELWQLLHEASSDGATDFVMEASSHALAERRLFGVRFNLSVFTNLSQDHLDFHGSMAEYEAAKWLLFTEYARQSQKPFVAAINTADEVGRRWATEVAWPTVTYSGAGADLQVDAKRIGVDSLELEATYREDTVPIHLKVGGMFNALNAASALAGLVALGYNLRESAVALESVTPVPGRFQAVPNSLGIGVLVDYAHTPDALRQLLLSARGLGPRRLITVFGCGGDRDRTKRPLMAEAASELSDLCVVTSDNPRTEDPEAIIHEVLKGIVPSSQSIAIVDRREAIEHAVNVAEPGDIVVIAGKGHEDYQIIGRIKHPMDDSDMARRALEERASCAT